MKSKLTYNQFCKIIDDLERRNHPVWKTADLEHREKLKSENVDFDMKRGKEMRERFYTLSYIERLDYWFDTYPKGEMFNTLQVIQDMPGDDLTNQGERDKKLISIFPQNDEEREIFFGYKMQRVLAARKDQYFAGVNEKRRNSEKAEFIKSELDKIESKLKRTFSSKETLEDKKVMAYKRGYESRLNAQKISGILSAKETTGYELMLQKEIVNGMVDFEYKHFLKEKLNEIESGSMDNRLQIERLRWLGSPEQFGLIFLELAGKGFIEMPGYKADGSYSAYATVCMKIFDIRNNKSGKETTLENMKRVLNPEKNKISDNVRRKFTIPFQKDI